MVTNAELQRVEPHGWRTGLANLLRKENRAWWASWRWLVQGLVWTVVVNGLVAVVLFLPGSPDSLGLGTITTGVMLLFSIGAPAMAIGAIILLQGGIIGERQLGVTEWLLSKPVSRPAYVLAKLLAHGLGMLVILVGLPAAVGYGLLWLAAGEPLPLLPFLVGVAGLAVHTLFYLAFTLMMGVLTASRNKLLGVSLAVLLGGTLVNQYLGPYLGQFVMLTPWSLGSLLSAAVLEAPLPLPVRLPIGLLAILAAICMAVALARFERLEF